MSEEARDRDWLDFEAWLDADGANRQAYDRVERLWHELELSSPRRAPARIGGRGGVLRWGALAAAASIAAIAVVGVTLGRRPVGVPEAAYQTAKGQMQQIALADGSRLRLNSGSRIAVALSRRERRVRLADGEIALDVAKDPARSFVVEAGERRVRVVGTEFDVLSHAGLIRIAVRRGVVEVRTAAAADEDPPLARLTAGDVLEHRTGASADQLVRTGAEAAFSWTERRLTYRDQSLQAVAEDLNRYLPAPIVVAPDAAGLRLTAVLDLDSEEAMLRRISGFLPVEAHREGAAYRLTLRRR